MYRFQAQACEIHGTYHCQSLLTWEDADTEEWVTTDAFHVSAEDVDAAGEHDAIMAVIRVACTRIAEKVDRTLC
jgi:hypothetical protein